MLWHWLSQRGQSNVRVPRLIGRYLLLRLVKRACPMVVAAAGNLADRPREAGRRATSHHAHAIELVYLGSYAY